MNNTRNKLTQILFLFTTLFMISCGEDLYEGSNQHQKVDKLIIQKVSLEEITSKGNFKIKKGVDFIKNLQVTNNTSKLIYNSDLNFYLDEENGKYTESTDGHSYTFPIYTNGENDFVKNIVFDSELNGEYKTYLIEYKLDKHQIDNLTTAQIENLDFDVSIVDDTTTADTFGKYPSPCAQIWKWDRIESNNGTNVGGAPLFYYGWVIAFDACSGVGIGAGNASGGDDGSGVTIITSPIGGGLTDDMGFTPSEAFINNLTPEQSEWLSNQPESVYVSILGYLNSNNYSTQSRDFIEGLIVYLLQNPSITFDDIFYNKTTFDTYNSNETGSYTSDGFDTNTYLYFNPQQNWTNIPSVIPVSQFVGWGAPGIKRNCMDYAKAQIAKKGYQISAYNASGQTFQIYTSQNGVNTTQLSQGLSYLKYALSNGIPVVVGVDDAAGHPGNLDNTTDHFIVIVGMGHNSNGNYFQFYDNASGSSSQGASSLNLLYYNSTTGIISGSSQTSYGQNQSYPYILTMIRKSKSL